VYGVLLCGSVHAFRSQQVHVIFKGDRLVRQLFSLICDFTEGA